MSPATDLLDTFDFGDNVDIETFRQILEMDEDEFREFSKSIVFGYMDTAQTTLTDMREAVRAKDLPQLSALGDFLRGSSATLGFTLIKNECEKIKHLGNHKDDTGQFEEPDEAKLIERCSDGIEMASSYYKVILSLMHDFYARFEAN